MPEFRRMNNGSRDACYLWINSFPLLKGQNFANNGGENKYYEQLVQEKMVGTLRMTANMV